MEKDILLIFDFDDTLVKTCVEFDRTNLETVEVVAKAIYGKVTNTENILVLQRKIDFELIHTYGFVPQRFISSWISTYEQFSQLEGVPTSEEVRENILNTVKDVYFRKYEDLPGNREILSQLKEEGYKMIILTAGIDQIQRRKIAEAGVGIFMNDIHVSVDKTPEVFRSIANQYHARDYVMIGNSLKSDIYPALENGAYGVHIERETWAADDHPINTGHPKYVHLKSLYELPEAIETIQNSVRISNIG